MKPMNDTEKELMSYALLCTESLVPDDVTATEDDEFINAMLEEVPEAQLEPITKEDIDAIADEPEPSIDDLLESLDVIPSPWTR